MVTYVIYIRDDMQVVYKYYPENDTEKVCGLIKVDLSSMEFSVKAVAEEDFLCRASAQEFYELRNAMNKMRLENNECPLTEEELPPVTKDCQWYYYAAHVISSLKEKFDKGVVPEKGTVVWY